MSVFPHSHLFFGPTFTTVISGPHIQVINTSSGDVLHTTAGRDDELKSGPVRCAAIDTTYRYLATSGEDKQLKIWAIDGLKLLSERELPKRPTAIRFTADGQTILVSDKFGDVFSYPFEFTPVAEPVKQTRDALSSHENPSGGQLILGHASLLTAFLLSPDERYIISADRDEHIRVSWYPQGYNIEMYCLGHTKFISAIHNPRFAPSELISGGGDAALKVWDWMTGTVKHEIDVWGVVEPFVRARSAKRRRGDDGDGDGEGARERAKRKGKGKKGGKGKGKAKADVVPDASAATESGEDATMEAQQTESEEKGEKVQVIHRIEAVASGAERYIVFSAVGVAALFVCPYPDGTRTSAVTTFDLGRPVVDFVVREDGSIWVSLDGNWTDGGEGSTSKMVRVFRLSEGKLEEAPLDSLLLSSLNEKCLLPATPQDLKRLDLYGDLTAMPKNTEGEQDQASDAPLLDETASAGKQISKKELGRLKSKQAVLARTQASDSRDDHTGGDDELKEPEPKKNKSEQGDDSRQDVEMTGA